MLEQAWQAGVPMRCVAGDEVYGDSLYCSIWSPVMTAVMCYPFSLLPLFLPYFPQCSYLYRIYFFSLGPGAPVFLRRPIDDCLSSVLLLSLAPLSASFLLLILKSFISFYFSFHLFFFILYSFPSPDLSLFSRLSISVFT